MANLYAGSRRHNVIAYNMVASLGLKRLANADWKSRNVVIFAIPLPLACGMKAVNFIDHNDGYSYF